MTGWRASGTDDIQPIVLRLPNSGESLPAFGPTTRKCALLAESGFILKVHLYAFVGMAGLDLSQRLREVFLKAS